MLRAVYCINGCFVANLVAVSPLSFFIPVESMPKWLAWLSYVYPLTYSVRLTLVNEFGECEGSAQFLCDELLDGVGAEEDDVWWYWLVLGAQFVIFRLLALFVLHQKAKKFY